MTKIVIGRANKGFEYLFGLSNAAVKMYYSLKGTKVHIYHRSGIQEYTQKSDSEFGDIIYMNKEFGDIFSGHLPHENRVFPEYIKRDDPSLIEVIEKLGNAASGPYCFLKIVEVPDNVIWEVEGGICEPEYVREVSRRWS